jgi:glutathione S-transferase
LKKEPDMKAPQSGLGPPAAGMARWRFLELLNFIATELHKGFGPLFKAETPPQVRDAVIDALGKRFTLLERKLEGKAYLTGEPFTIVDAYAYVVLNWTNYHKIDVGPWPGLKSFLATRQGRPAVQQALREEGLPI